MMQPITRYRRPMTADLRRVTQRSEVLGALGKEFDKSDRGRRRPISRFGTYAGVRDGRIRAVGGASLPWSAGPPSSRVDGSLIGGRPQPPLSLHVRSRAARVPAARPLVAARSEGHVDRPPSGRYRGHLGAEPAVHPRPLERVLPDVLL